MMDKINKWQMNRAGLLNFWYYSDEIFNFADGKLLLRGSNGSGKSVTMQSILPVLLDGRTSSDRLDPFGSRARKIEDYLLGEKEIVDREERTGYLFLEFKQKDLDQYITVGIGLQARRYKNLNFWGFVITDNRRINKDFYLYEEAYNAGEKQQLPLSRVQLENRIGNGGHVVKTRGEYRALVNKYIFGFETNEAYEDLIKLLIQLRSPKLSKDFRPTVIYEILEAALPPLTDEDLRHLSDTIEHMDQTKQQIEQLEREQTSLQRIIEKYDLYNTHRLIETAQHYIKTQKQVTEMDAKLKDEKKHAQSLTEEITILHQRNKVLSEEEEVLEKQKERLEKHEVWNLEEEKIKEENALQLVQADIQRKDTTLTQKVKQELRNKEQLDQIETNIYTLERTLADQLEELADIAEMTAFEQHGLNEDDFKRNKTNKFDFSVWHKEANTHYSLLEQIEAIFRQYEQEKEAITVLEGHIATLQRTIDKKENEKADWERIFERDKQTQMSEIHHWVKEHPYMTMDEALLQETSRQLENLYEKGTYDDIRTPYYRATNNFERKINEVIAEQTHSLNIKNTEKKERELLLEQWKEAKDPEPPYMQEATIEARTHLLENNIAFVPFYEAVEFQAHVDEATKKHIEAALIDAGLIQALVTDVPLDVTHDKVIQPNPQLMAHTLADYLQPDVDESQSVSQAHIEEVLQSIIVDEIGMGESTVIRTDGTYTIGLLKGHAVPVEAVRFIGKNARKRYRLEQIALLTEEISKINEEINSIYHTRQTLESDIAGARKMMEQFPDDTDLQTAFQYIQQYDTEIRSYDNQMQQENTKLSNKLTDFHTLKREIHSKTRNMPIDENREAYYEAKNNQLIYERTLHTLANTHMNIQNESQNERQTRAYLEDISDEIDDIKGEINMLQGRVSTMNKNIAMIEEQLQSEEAENIREEIQQVMSKLTSIKTEITDNNQILPHKEAAYAQIETAIQEMIKKLHFEQKMLEAWKSTFEEEKTNQFIKLPEEDNEEKLAKWIISTWRDAQNDGSKIESQLAKVFYEERSNLLEYRMTEQITTIQHMFEPSEFWTNDQTIVYHHWLERAKRRIIQLDFEGKRLSPYAVHKKLTEDYTRQQTYLNEKDEQLYEEILFESVGKKLRSRIQRAENWTKQMNALMKESDSGSGITFSIQWKPRTAESEEQLDTKDLVQLLRRDPRLLKEDDLHAVSNHFRSKIDRAKELSQYEGEGNTLLQVLKEVLDYRYWFSFVLSFERLGEPKRELTNNRFYQFSGGEKAMAMYIPLFTACYSRYKEADPSAPYIISLDEAFAGVDDENISTMFNIVEQLDFDYIMNSQILWGDYPTVSNLSIYELIRPKNANFVSLIPYHWDGKVRQQVEV